MRNFKPLFVGAALAGSLVASPLMAYEAGDFVARAGWARVSPNDSAENFEGVAGDVTVEDADSLGLTFTYMFTDNIGLGVLGSWPFTVDIKGDSGALAGAGKLGEAKALPPTVTLQYHFNTGTALQPYIGAGVNYTYFFDEDTDGAIGALNLNLEDSFGLVGEAGVDFDLGNDYLVSAQVWYMQMSTQAHVSGGVGNADVDVDPWVFMIGIGKKF
ncbi:MAG TPA: hypothetical protein ENJ79_11185 [Gammaproteobacteria bacterium]|nr:hypothetical protein [Gammaproteobacteria bacterium]